MSQAAVAVPFVSFVEVMPDGTVCHELLTGVTFDQAFRVLTATPPRLWEQGNTGGNAFDRLNFAGIDWRGSRGPVDKRGFDSDVLTMHFEKGLGCYVHQPENS